MARTSIKLKNWLKKRIRTKKSLGTLGKYPRLVINKSNKHIYTQLVDDIKSITLLSSSSIEKDLISKDKNKSKTDMSILVGNNIADKISSKRIKKIIFDRNGYKYHGRVKALAEAMRKKGINF